MPLQVRLEGIESPGFPKFLRHERNLWIYGSNIVEFTYGRLRLDHPENAVIVSVVYPGQCSCSTSRRLAIDRWRCATRSR